jgi:hypothetical protein
MMTLQKKNLEIDCEIEKLGLIDQARGFRKIKSQYGVKVKEDNKLQL